MTNLNERTMRYTIEFAGFEPGTADTRGYDSGEFLTATPPTVFAAEADANAWLAAHDKGADCEGVVATWRVEVAS